MHAPVDFLLHLAFGGFLFLSLLYVLCVVFFLSPRKCSPVSLEHQTVGERRERVTLLAQPTPDTGPEIVEEDGVAFSRILDGQY
jgi:hypothetical protein